MDKENEVKRYSPQGCEICNLEVCEHGNYVLLTDWQAERARREEAEKKYKDLNKSLMAELRDPNGTIWEVARDYQKKNDELEAKVKELEAIINTKEYLPTIANLSASLATANAKIVELEKDRNYWKKSADDYSFINRELSAANKKAEKLVGALNDALELVKLIKGGYGYSLQGFNDTFEQALKEFRGGV